MPNRDTTLVICNPAAGAGRASDRWSRLEASLRCQCVPFEVRWTCHPGHATRLALDAIAQGFRRIAVFGGDGTLHEAIQGMMSAEASQRSLVELIFLAAGTSCDFDKAFPRRKSLLERFTSRQVRSVDLIRIQCHDANGQLETHYAANASNIGLITEGTEEYNRKGKVIGVARQIGVDVGVIVAGIRSIMKHKPVQCTISVDDAPQRSTSLSNLTVFKTPWIAGGMRFGVTVQPDDGTLAMVTFEARSKTKLLRIIPSLYSGRSLEHKQVHYGHYKSVFVETDSRMPVESDGEIIGFTPVSYSVAPAAISIVI